MGARGPARAPTAILKLRGSAKARHRTNEPDAPIDDGGPPEWLGAGAKRQWRLVAPQLRALGVLGKCDRSALARYCEAWASWRDATALLAREGLTCASAHGGIAPHPAVGIVAQLNATLLRFEAQFGLTPSARSSLRVDGHDATRKDLEALIAKEKA